MRTIITALVAITMLVAPAASALTPPSGDRPVCADTRDNDGDSWPDCMDQFSCWKSDQCPPEKILSALEKFAEEYGAQCTTEQCRKSLAAIRRQLDRVAKDGIDDTEFYTMRQARDDLDKVRAAQEQEIDKLRKQLEAAKARAAERPYCARYVPDLEKIDVSRLGEKEVFALAVKKLELVEGCGAKHTVDMDRLVELSIRKSGDRDLLLSSDQFSLVLDKDRGNPWAKKVEPRFPTQLKWIFGATVGGSVALASYMKGNSGSTTAALSLGIGGSVFGLTWGVEGIVNK